MKSVWLMLGAAFLFLVQGASAQCQQYTPNTIFSWKKSVEFQWPNSTFMDATRAAANNHFGVPIGIKVTNDKVFMTIPRWRGNEKVPANVVWAPKPTEDCPGETIAPLLRPYPTWEMQKIGDCRAFQYVQSATVDPGSGVMWLPDNGYVGTYDGSQSRRENCPPKMVLVDTASDEIIKVYEFPAFVASHDRRTFLNDIVLDPDNNLGYISDAQGGKIIVYDSQHDSSWVVEHSTMKANPQAAKLEFISHPESPSTFLISVDGIAITPKTEGGDRYVLYCPLSSLELFYINTKHLTKAKFIGRKFYKLIDKPSQSDGLMMADDWALYFSGITSNTMYKIKVKPDEEDIFKLQSSPIEAFAQDNETLIWADTLALDERQEFLWTTTRGWPIDKNMNYVVNMKIK